VNISRREMMLAVAASAIVLAGGSLWLGLPMLKEWRKLHGEGRQLRQRVEMADRLLRQRTDVDSRMLKLREIMPEYAVDTDVTSQLLKNLQSTADQYGVSLLRQEPEKEKQAGSLYEMSISCTWEASLDGLTRFLFALTAQGSVVDVQQLSVSPAQGNGSRLKGNFKVDYAYSRIAIPESSDPVPAPES